MTYTLEVKITKDATEETPENLMFFITFPDLDQEEMESFREDVLKILSSI